MKSTVRIQILIEVHITNHFFRWIPPLSLIPTILLSVSLHEPLGLICVPGDLQQTVERNAVLWAIDLPLVVWHRQRR